MSHHPTSTSGARSTPASKSVAHTGVASRQMMLPGRGSPQHSPTGLVDGRSARSHAYALVDERVHAVAQLGPAVLLPQRDLRVEPGSAPGGHQPVESGGAPVDIVHAAPGS